MFKTKLVSSNATTSKPRKTHNVLVNVVVVVTSQSQQLEQHVFKEKELVKTKRTKDWQKEARLHDLVIETIKQLQHSGLKTNLLPSMKVHCRVIGLDCLIILP
jgi:hypothetical protein